MNIVRVARAAVLAGVLSVPWVYGQTENLAFRSAPMAVCVSNTYSVVLDYVAAPADPSPRTIVVNLLNPENGWSWHGGDSFSGIAVGGGAVTARVTVLGTAMIGTNYLWSSFIGTNTDWQQAYKLIEQGPVAVRAPDADEDGLPDTFELQYSGTTTNMSPGGDEDHDGYSNHNEFMAGTSPADGADYLGVWIRWTNAIPGLFVGWKSCDGRFYNLERSTNLLVPPVVIESNVAATVPWNVSYDPAAVREGPYFYRVKVVR